MDEQGFWYDILRFDYKNRLEDRFIATHLHRFEVFTQPVVMAMVVEILSPWHPASELGQKLINELIREFVSTKAQSFLTRFEASLHQANRLINAASSQLRTPVSCAVVLLENHQVHCAGSGQATVGLNRQGKSATIISPKTNQPLFNDVTSGDLHLNDWLILANIGFYKSLEQLPPLSWDSSPDQLATQLFNLPPSKNKDYWAGLFFHRQFGSPNTSQTFFWDDDASSTSRSANLSWVNPRNWGKNSPSRQ